MQATLQRCLWSSCLRLGLTAMLLFGSSVAVWAQTDNQIAKSSASEGDLERLVDEGKVDEAFDLAVEEGHAIFGGADLLPDTPSDADSGASPSSSVVDCFAPFPVSSLFARPGDFARIKALHAGLMRHTDQILDILNAANPFEVAFTAGDRVFETSFNAIDGIGSNVGQCLRFSLMARPDLGDDAGEEGLWFTHFPIPVTGPNASACNQCHGGLFDDSAGTAATANHRDLIAPGIGPGAGQDDSRAATPAHGEPHRPSVLHDTIRRDTPHLFGLGAQQRLAEEMTDELIAIRQRALNQAQAHCPGDGDSGFLPLSAKGVSFGQIRARCQGERVVVIATRVEGVDPDLIIKFLGWRGIIPFVRIFARLPAPEGDLGIQAEEFVGTNVDADSDGVANEMQIGDVTALTVYNAAQPRPTNNIELSLRGLLDPPVTFPEALQIFRGAFVFNQIGCTECHRRTFRVEPMYSEPSQNPRFRDGAMFPAGQSTVDNGVDPRRPVTFDLTRDIPENPGFGNFRRDAQGRAIMRLFGDLKRHRMGPRLANEVNGEPHSFTVDVETVFLDPTTGERRRAQAGELVNVVIPADTFLTEGLWGLGSTGPYLHDGRATTPTEAILEHGGEAEEARDAFIHLVDNNRARAQDLIAFLESLALFKATPEPDNFFP